MRLWRMALEEHLPSKTQEETESRAVEVKQDWRRKEGTPGNLDRIAELWDNVK